MTTPAAEPRPQELRQKEQHSARRHVLMAVKISVSLVLLTILFSRIDRTRLWASAQQASIVWLIAALAIYFVNVLASVWRWKLLLDTQQVDLPPRTLLSSFLVAQFFNNFLPSNIGGDVIRIRDTAKAAKSKTLATTVILVDRVIGLIGLVLVAAFGATMAAIVAGHVPSPIWPMWLWVGFLVAMVVSAP